MAYTPGADTQTAFKTSKDTQVTDILSHSFNGTKYRIKGKIVTTVVEFRGLGRAEALAMGESNDYNYREMHSVSFTNGVITMWYPDCEGTECKAVPRRINDADMFRVIVTHVQTIASFNRSGFTKYTF